MTRAKWSDIKAQRAAEDPAFGTKVNEAHLRLDLAQFVYDLRMAAGLTQTELARRMGTTQSAIARLEGGGMNPSAELLQHLGVALGVRLVLSVEHASGLRPVVISGTGTVAQAS